MQFDSFINKLSDLLKQPLPGHSNLPSRIENKLTLKLPEPNEKTRMSAVLMAFYPFKNDIYFPLILRPLYDGTHGGQVAFPGGQVELEDENLKRTALREAQEEVGIKAIDVTVLGKLTKIYIPPSNFWVTPYIGYLNYRPDFFPDPREVDRVIEVSLNDLINKFEVEERSMLVNGLNLRTKGFSIDNQWVWGATALMLHEFLDIQRRA